MSDMSELLYGYELLLFKRFQTHPDTWLEWRQKILEKTLDDGMIEDLDDIGSIPQSLWFLSVALHKRQKYLIQLIKSEVMREKQGLIRKSGETLFSTYLNAHRFTEFHLDSIFKYGEENSLPLEIFKCPNLSYLSLKYNCLYELPADIGRLQKLRYLALTNNKLHVQSLPYSLIFCQSLETLLLDNNLLDALPGFLLQIPSLETVHRHGNHNYFKSTFMWYHTDVHYRIIPIMGNKDSQKRQQHTLQFLAAQCVIGSKKDFFSDPSVAPVLKDFICSIYDKFSICHFCEKAVYMGDPGYKVITFKNPYLGNTCVPFQHWACTKECAISIEVPARLEQIAAATELDTKYRMYIQECERAFFNNDHIESVCSCLGSSASDMESLSTKSSASRSTCIIS
ncbi:hypothetical protein CHS0354_007655 [Potamilus streckersoni]|uniref:Uncharacterized protein n=1 Tax=Potamilus streckersoni TaxID=2493646 RepID=A0AAE0SHZ2_9BIVA|nr:hypothetical protein CHS0354_007655 [Potamilus streckersoni]